MLGQRVGAWVPLDEVPDVWEAVTSVFRDYGYRRLRSKARLKFLIKDWGVEKFREVLEKEYLSRKLIDGPAPEPGSHPSTTSACSGSRTASTPSASPRSPVGCPAPSCPRWPTSPKRAGSDRIRFTPYQKLIILDVADDKVAKLVARLDALGLPSQPVALAART